MNWNYWHTLPKRVRIPLIVVGVAFAGFAFLLVFGYIVMWLWNQVVASVFDVSSVTFWQALGLLVLAKLFFGFGGGGGGARHQKRKRHRERASLDTMEETLPAVDDRFKKYWREEGKQAYDDYLAIKRASKGRDERT
jgi:hypothetical protein